MKTISIFDIFKIGIGPSSSHTIGPWRAAGAFVKTLERKGLLRSVIRIRVEAFGSLAKTGAGHGTDLGIVLGLTGADIQTVDTSRMFSQLESIRKKKLISLDGVRTVEFDEPNCIVFNKTEIREAHPNTLEFSVGFEGGESFSETYYSVGGGFILLEGGATQLEGEKSPIPFPVDTAADMIRWHHEQGQSIADISLANELRWRTHDELRSQLKHIWQVMLQSVYLGCHTDGVLPGGLNVRRRAAQIDRDLFNGRSFDTPQAWIEAIKLQPRTMDRVLSWVSCFALAVNEVNASYGRVVTAPTNGAAGVIPAVLMYYICFHDNVSWEQIERFLLVAGEIGIIFKKGATISAAAGGCQAEIGVSSSMAAAALAFSLGGSTEQSLMAAEIAMEHHLGLTCDPVGGLVQVPCIERNAMGAAKAITAAQLALHSDPAHARVSLDEVVATMWETACDMNRKYKETSEGGLAVLVNIADC